MPLRWRDFREYRLIKTDSIQLPLPHFPKSPAFGRRTLLRSGATLGGGVLLGYSGRLVGAHVAETLPAVEERVSITGVLDTSMTLAITTNTIDGFTSHTRTFDGLIPGPTLRLKRGDTLRFLFRNDMPPNPPGEPVPNTLHDYSSFNLHTHGLHVDPTGNADNVFLNVLPGQTHRTEIRIPPDHPGGLFWYHPHKHGAVLAQMKSGMAGAIVIEGDLDDVPEDERKIDYSIPLGTVEEWTIQNNSNRDHPFRIHTNPFEVMEINGQPLAQKRWMDVVNVPANGNVKFRIRFEDFDGKFVLHCHNVFHADFSMMKNVYVFDPVKILPVIDLLLSD